MVFWAKKGTPRDSQPSVNSKLHRSPTGPVTSLQLEKCKHRFYCGIHAEEMGYAFCVNVCILALQGGEDERSLSIQGAHRGGSRSPSTPLHLLMEKALHIHPPTPLPTPTGLHIKSFHFTWRREGEGRRQRGG